MELEQGHKPDELGISHVQINEEELASPKDPPNEAHTDPPNPKPNGTPRAPRRLPPIGGPDDESRPPSQLRRRVAALQAEAVNDMAIKPDYTPRHKLAIDNKTLRVSLIALRIAVFADAINSQILSPNFPIMCVPHGTVGAHEDSWDSTGGFGFNAAVYFVMMSGQLGTAIASTGMGALSDRCVVVLPSCTPVLVSPCVSLSFATPMTRGCDILMTRVAVTFYDAWL